MKFFRSPFFIIALAVLAVFGRTIAFDFVRWDDYLHVVENPELNPPTWASLAYFWTSAHQGLYIPLAYSAWTGIARLSLLVAGGYRLRPQLFHLANILLHLANAFLAFAVLRSLLAVIARKSDPSPSPRAIEASALMGGLLFAIHPLQVETVAWVTGLRDLLCGFFSLLSAYFYFREAPRGRVPLAFACSVPAMLAKPAAIMVPAILAWLEWGLVFGLSSFKDFLGARGPRFLRWVVVLAPLAFLAKALQPTREFTFVPGWGGRLLVAGDAVRFYLWKLLFPLYLVPEYHHAPADVLGHGWILASAATPVILTAILLARPLPRLFLVPFGAFTLALLPMLGFVPFGYQTYSTVADRYAYLAMLGAGLGFGLLALVTHGRRWIAIAGWSCLAVLGARSFLQTAHWQNSLNLSRHTLRYNPGSYGAHLNLGIDLKDSDIDEAIRQFELARGLRPAEPGVYINLGSAYATRGDYERAESMYERALALDPRLPSAHLNLAKLLVVRGRVEQSGSHFAAAVRLDPGLAFEAHSVAGLALLQAGDDEAAVMHLRQALDLRPGIPSLHNELGVAFARHGLARQARVEFQEALRLDPSDSEARENLARAVALGRDP